VTEKSSIRAKRVKSPFLLAAIRGICICSFLRVVSEIAENKLNIGAFISVARSGTPASNRDNEQRSRGVGLRGYSFEAHICSSLLCTFRVNCSIIESRRSSILVSAFITPVSSKQSKRNKKKRGNGCLQNWMKRRLAVISKRKKDGERQHSSFRRVYRAVRH